MYKHNTHVKVKSEHVSATPAVAASLPTVAVSVRSTVAATFAAPVAAASMAIVASAEAAPVAAASEAPVAALRAAETSLWRYLCTVHFSGPDVISTL